ncbi:hypothetical protein [Streptomyces sp. NPDC002676]
MPYPPPPRTPSGPRRRTLLASVAGAALLAGCTADPDSGGGGSTAATQARARAARDSAGLLEQYDAVLAAHPALAKELRPLRAAVAAHVKAFGGKAAGAATKSASPTASRTASPVVPPRPKDALASLADAERGVADRRARDLLQVPGELARLLASVSAAGVAHAYLLTEGAK